MQSCESSCPKLKRKPRSSPRPEPQPDSLDSEDLDSRSKNVSKSALLNRRRPSQRQKSVQIVGVTALEAENLSGSKISEKTVDSTDRDQDKDSHSSIGRAGTKKNSGKSSPQNHKEERNKFSEEPIPRSIRSHDQTEGNSASGSVNRTQSPQKFEESIKYGRMSPTGGKSSRETNDVEWDSTGHDPCPPSCPMTRARDMAMRKAQLRQERLDDYLLNKGFSYFDDLCTCSSICLMNQLKRDKFVIDVLKSACLFCIGMKLCDELDAWNYIIG